MLVGVDVEFDLGQLHVDRQVDQHRSRPAGTHQVEGLLEGAGQLARLAHGVRPLGDGPGQRLDVHCLEIFLVQPRPRGLARDAQDRDAVGAGRVQPGDHVGAAGPGGADAHADVAGPGPRVALGHVRRTLDVAGQHVRDRLALAQGRVQRVDRGARDAERVRDAFLFHDQHRGHRRFHFRHVCLLGGKCRSAQRLRIMKEFDENHHT
jgi:hypothetical protein